MQDPQLINEYVFTRSSYWILALEVATERTFSVSRQKMGTKIGKYTQPSQLGT